MDRSVFEDMTAKEVLGVNDTLPTFRMFYETVRPAITAGINEYVREESKEVTYNDMYRLFRYWSSQAYRNLIKTGQANYREHMSWCQTQVDSVADHYRAAIDSVKASGKITRSSYGDLIKRMLPDLIYEYMEAQEGKNLSKYISARNKMITVYADPTFHGSDEYLSYVIDQPVVDMFPDAWILFNVARNYDEKGADDFLARIGKASYTAEEWIAPDLRLPVEFPNGKYINPETEILAFGKTYSVSQTVSEDRRGNSTRLTIEMTAYEDGSVSGRVIETETLAHRSYDPDEFTYPFEGKWTMTSRHDRPVMRIFFELARSEQYYVLYVDEEQNVYLNDLNAKPYKLYLVD